MSEQTPSGSPPQNRRRSSIIEMFTSRPNPSNQLSSSPPSNQTTATPDMPQHRRGTSITAMGLAGSTNGQTSPFNAFAKQRRASFAGSSGSGSPEFRNSFGDEPAVIEEDDTLKVPQNPAPGSFGRRLSFGAQAMRDVKQGNAPGSPATGRRPSSSLFTLDENNENDSPLRPGSSGKAKAPGEGFTWSESLRNQTKRSPSFSSGNPFSMNRARASSISAPEAAQPPKEMPKPIETPKSRMKKPDHLGERMLRGDFMMD